MSFKGGHCLFFGKFHVVSLNSEKHNDNGAKDNKKKPRVNVIKINCEENDAHNGAKCPCRAFNNAFEALLFNHPRCAVIVVKKVGVFITAKLNLLSLCKNEVIDVALALDFKFFPDRVKGDI